MKISFHREGKKILIGLALILVLINLFLYLESYSALVFASFVCASLLLFFVVAQFFRNPSRDTDIWDDIKSPVDGKVVVIEDVFENEYFKCRCTQVSVFMSPTNVHVTRYPVSGNVLYSKYHRGKYLVAWHPKSSTHNERTTVVVENPDLGQVMYRQVAGAMARRIVNYAKVGDEVVQGEDSGFIKFGSRVDVLFPVDFDVLVELGQKVRGGVTILARKNEPTPYPDSSGLF